MEPTEEEVKALVTESMGALNNEKAREILTARKKAEAEKAEAEKTNKKK